MNKIGIYYAYWTRNWDADFVPFIGKVKKLGFDILEVNSGTVANMSDRERGRLKDAAEKEGIELTACIGLEARYDIASEDAAVRRAGVAFLEKQAHALMKTNIHKIGGIVYSYWPGSLPADQTDKRPAWGRSVKSMKEVMKTAEDCGVIFHMEVVNRFEQYLLNTAEEALEYVKDVNSPNCRILLDTFHMNIEEDSFENAIRTAGKYLGHVHIGETNRRAPGRGKMPWDIIFSSLKKINFKGAVVMEPFLIPGGEVGRDIRIFRDLGVTNLDKEAAKAVKFVRGKIRAAGG